METLNILILEDVDEDADLIMHELRSDGLIFTTTRIDSRDEFLKAIREDRFDIILSDHSLPQFNSMEALKICRRLGLLIPFVLITGTVSEEFAVLCLKQGAEDYILKSNLSRLPQAVRSAISKCKLQEQRLKDELELRQQNEKLLKVNQELDNFVYSVSHNLRSPLMSVLGLVNLAQKEDDERDSYFSSYFQMINQSIGKLDDTLKEILDYSRNTRSETVVSKIDIAKMVNDCLDQLRYLKEFNRVETCIVVEGNDPFYSDYYRLQIIFKNLFSNALKYCDVHKDQCQITLHAAITPQHVSLCVEDNGIGIRKNLMPKVLTMFFRGTEKSDGAGLGLYIVKETVSRMEGTLTIDSTEGVGTTVRITLPNHCPVEKPATSLVY